MSRNFWRGEGVQLCAVQEADLEALLTPEEDTEIDRYEDFIRFPSTREQRRAFFEAMAKRDGKDDTFFWLIKDLEGRHVGNIGTFDCDRRVGAFKYGLRILHPYWGRGYAREAIGLVLRYYFHELRYQKVTVIVYSFNERSRRLHEGLGFAPQSRLRRTVYTGGAHHNELYFELAREEFDGRHRPAGP
jgi:RimJ/RimL family protein N-acetyltransferase